MLHGMDILPIPLPRSITVYCSPAAAGDTVIKLVAELALCGPVTILDGGNCFPAYSLLRAIRRRTTQLAAITQQVFVRRAFTCHQMLALLEGTPCLPQPYILLNPLDTFYDEQIPEAEIRRLLEVSLLQMERLAQGAPVLASITPPAGASFPCGSHLFPRPATLHAGSPRLPAPIRPASFNADRLPLHLPFGFLRSSKPFSFKHTASHRSAGPG
jgi:hypothetical protein